MLLISTNRYFQSERVKMLVLSLFLDRWIEHRYFPAIAAVWLIMRTETFNSRLPKLNEPLPVGFVCLQFLASTYKVWNMAVDEYHSVSHRTLSVTVLGNNDYSVSCVIIPLIAYTFSCEFQFIQILLEYLINSDCYFLCCNQIFTLNFCCAFFLAISVRRCIYLGNSCRDNRYAGTITLYPFAST